MIVDISKLPDQVCFPINGNYILCNWTHCPKRKNSAIVSDSGKWIKVESRIVKKQAFNDDEDVKDLIELE